MPFVKEQARGGAGSWPGGEGIEREYLFEEAVTVSLLTQRRTTGPEGISGGLCGLPGEQFLIRENGEKMELKSIDSIDAKPGDRLFLKTPRQGVGRVIRS